MSGRINIGVDIGKNGAIVINDNGEIISLPMPLIGKELDVFTLRTIFSKYREKDVMVLFEKIVPFVENKSTAFSMGQQSGAIEMVCVSYSIPYTKIPPQTWQKEMFTGVEEIPKTGGGRDTKKMALIAIQRLLPTLKLTFGTRSHKPHDGLIDAALMSEYLKRKL